MNLKFVAAIAAFFLLLFFGGCIETNPANSNSLNNSASQQNLANAETFTGYQNFKYGIKIDYPSNWVKSETDPNAIVVFQSPKESDSDAFQENVNITLNDLEGRELTLQDYTDAAIENLPSVFEDFKLVESGAIIVSNENAAKLVYSGKLNGKSFKTLQAIAIKNGISYIMTYSSEEQNFSKYLGEVQKMIESFEITKNLKEENSSTAEQAEANLPSNSLVDEPQEPIAPVENSSLESLLAGEWMAYSEAIYYDAGGSDLLGSPTTRRLELNADKTWSFGTSNGTWETKDITASDWEKWDTGDYGPAKKIVLNNWNNGVGDGPIEESGSRIDFFWLIYSAEPPSVTTPGQIQMKFGHSSKT